MTKRAEVHHGPIRVDLARSFPRPPLSRGPRKCADAVGVGGGG